MKYNSNGCYIGSEMFFFTPSPNARKFYYYPDVCGHIYSGPYYKIDRKTYNDYLLIYVEKGRMNFVNEEIPGQIGPGQAFLMNCHAQHSYSTPVDTEFWYVHFDHHDMESFYQHIKETSGIICTFSNSSLILDPLKLLVSHLKYQKQFSEAWMSRQIYAIISSFLIEQDSSQQNLRIEHKLITQVMNYINEHFSEDLSLDKIAAQYGVSQHYLSHLFKRCTGQSPYDYIILTRLNRAKQLLASTERSVFDIAYDVGYSSDTGFINSFTKKIGISPRKFRLYYNS
ncbi:MAG: helix-turn-helix transcriptional regulator [Eubacterium sp.]|nr:helix-turn-helix transcriptional regulator [Eubacterium sp.]